MKPLLAALVFSLFAGAGHAQVSLTAVATGLDQPWGVAPLPGGGALVTERDGALRIIRDGRKQRVAGTPRVAASGQGGLLDITLARDFGTTRELFLTYAKPQPQGAGTALASARLSDDGRRLENLRVLFEAAPVGTTGRHYGSRVVEARDGTLFVTIGDRGDRPSAQDRRNHNGAIVRVNRDGSVPRDNPFIGQAGIRPEIWSFGHRNPQGAGLDARGQLWTAEHGAKGRRRGQFHPQGRQFRLARHLLWTPLFGGQDRRGCCKTRYGATGLLLGPFNGALWPAGLSRANVPRLARGYVRRITQVRLYFASGHLGSVRTRSRADQERRNQPRARHR